MPATLKVISNPSPPGISPVTAGRPYLHIVKALALDRVPVKTKATKSRNKKNPAGTTVQAGTPFDPAAGRNNHLISLAGSMRRRGMSQEAIEAALQAENLTAFNPPLSQGEVSQIAASVMRYPAALGQDVMKTLTDVGNADRFGARYQDELKYAFGTGWMFWNGVFWQRDQLGQVIELAKALLRGVYQEGDALDDTARVAVARHGVKSQQAARLHAMLDLAESLPALAIKTEQLDSDDMLLGVANGVVDLHTGQLQLSRREDLITRVSPVEFDAQAQCPKFMAFLQQITGGKKPLMTYLQRIVGYSLTGSTSEQCLFFLHGQGANGKSTFLNVLKDLLGNELAKQTPTETLMSNRSRATNDLARLAGVRVVMANEVENGCLLAESLVKQMTGGDPISARFHYQEYFDLIPKFKLFIAGNHKPTIRGRDQGMWRRIQLIPFETTIPAAQRDKNLQQKLRLELPGILNWAIQGCLAWQKSGLATPKVITDAVNSYREEMDVVGHWVAECCDVEKAAAYKAGEAYQSYKYWAERNGYLPMASGSFSRELEGRFQKVKRKEGNYFMGVKPIA